MPMRQVVLVEPVRVPEQAPVVPEAPVVVMAQQVLHLPIPAAAVAVVVVAQAAVLQLEAMVDRLAVLTVPVALQEQVAAP